MSLLKLIEKAALMNAVTHNGKATEKAVLGKVLAEKLQLRNNVLKVSEEIRLVLPRINKLSLDAQKSRLMQIDPNFFEEKEEAKKELPPLKNAKQGKVVLRFEPAPSGPMHIGHSFPLLLNAGYADKYDGKLIIRISDTNPAGVYKKAYDHIDEDSNWLTEDRVDEVHIQSDRMALYYNTAEELIKKDVAYICTCDPEKFKFLLSKKTACPCRTLPPAETLERWKDMFGRYIAGDAVMRIKTDLEHKNPAMRDFPVFRIAEDKHPRQGTKYRVWPLMNLAVAVDDHTLGLTHVIRGKDHADNTLRQAYIFDAMGWKKPQYIHHGRIQFTGIKISKREFLKGVKEKEYSGFDDVRLPTLKALRRRGLQPEAFRKYVIGVGPSNVDKRVSFEEFMKIIYAHNREIIDPIANRYSFVADPIEIEIPNAPKDIQEISVPISPYSGKTRQIKVNNLICIAKSDFERFYGTEIRLKDLYNIKLDTSGEFTSQPNKKIQKIQWVSKSAVKTEILMPDGTVVKGVAEPNIKKLKVGAIIQFERFGFCKLDRKLKTKQVFCFTHK